MVGRLGCITGLAQFDSSFGDALFQLLVELQQPQLSQFALGDIGNETLDQTIFIRFEQQVHYYVDRATVLATQAGLIAKQAPLITKNAADAVQLFLTADE